MANFIFNIAKGRIIELYNHVESNSPAGCEIVILAINAGSATDATMMDYDNLSLLLGDAQVAEVTNAGYARKFLVAADLASLPAPDDANDRFDVTFPDQTWTAVAAAGGAWTDLVIAYDPLGTGVDTNTIPLSCHDFGITPDGSDITADFGTVTLRAA